MERSSGDRRFFLFTIGTGLLVWLATIPGPGDYPSVLHVARGWTLFCIPRLPRFLPAVLALAGLSIVLREGVRARGARLRWTGRTLALAIALALATWLLTWLLCRLLVADFAWGGPVPRKLKDEDLGVARADARRALASVTVLVYPVVAILVSLVAYLATGRMAKGPGWRRALPSALLLPICLIAAATPWARGRDTRDDRGRTPLFRAAEAGDRDMVDALLRAGADANARDRVGWTPLLCAVCQGDPGAVRRLLASGADARAKAPTEELDFAFNLFFGVRGVILSKEDPRPPSESDYQRLLDQRGLTTPMLAVQAGSEEVLRDVLEAGADPSYVQHPENISGSALLLAIGAQRLDLVRLLLAFHADVHSPMQKGTSLLCAPIYFDEEEILRALLQAGATPTADDLCTAVERGKVGIVRALLEAKVDVNLPRADGRTPLSLAKDPEIQNLLRAAK